jgi:gamma-glutamylcyclotransferase
MKVVPLKYFAYALNLNKKQMLGHCPDARPISTAVLPNYRLIFAGWSRTWHGAVATIKLERGQRVRGAIYEISDACAQRLDGFEGSTFERLNVVVFDENDEPMQAYTYAKTSQLDAGEPTAEYLAVIQQGLRDWRLF